MQPLRPKSRSEIAEDLTALDAAVSAINLQHRVESASNIVAHIQGGYNADPMFARVAAALPQHVHYWMKNGLLYTATIIQDVPTLLRLRFSPIIRNGLSHIV